MPSRLSSFIGFRYIRAKKKNHFISFISMISVLGIALGVMVLITVLSVVNGFEHEIKTRLLMLMPQITVTNWQGEVQDVKRWMGLLQKVPRVEGIAPFIQVQAMLGSIDQPTFAVIKGVDPIFEKTVSPIADQLYEGSLDDLKSGEFGLIIGKGLAEHLGLERGDRVTVFVPKATPSIMGMAPRIKAFTIVGLFETKFEYDHRYALMHIQDAATLLKMQGAVSGIELAIDQPFETDQVIKALLPHLPPPLLITDWKRQNHNLFSALQMMKSTLFFVLILIVSVAVFNMLSSMVMLVMDKQADIAILRTMGASQTSILGIFIVQGMTIGAIGCALGAIGGVLLSTFLTTLVSALEGFFQVRFIPEGVYLIDFLPCELQGLDVIVVVGITLFLSFLATLYPAYRASRVDPVEALRDE